jgi:hypothetical protein
VFPERAGWRGVLLRLPARVEGCGVNGRLAPPPAALLLPGAVIAKIEQVERLRAEEDRLRELYLEAHIRRIQAELAISGLLLVPPPPPEDTESKVSASQADSYWANPRIVNTEPDSPQPPLPRSDQRRVRTGRETDVVDTHLYAMRSGYWRPGRIGDPPAAEWSGGKQVRTGFVFTRCGQRKLLPCWRVIPFELHLLDEPTELDHLDSLYHADGPEWPDEL